MTVGEVGSVRPVFSGPFIGAYSNKGTQRPKARISGICQQQQCIPFLPGREAERLTEIGQPEVREVEPSPTLTALTSASTARKQRFMGFYVMRSRQLTARRRVGAAR